MRHGISVRVLSLLAPLLIIIAYSIDSAFGAGKISQGGNLPGFRLDAPDEPAAKEYLGLKNLKSFGISQISAKFVIIEFFSLYCPICQKQAPVANRIYKIIQQDQELSKNVKMIGIGAGNNRREIDTYGTGLRIPFPLFTDTDFTVYKKIGEPRTPFTILATTKGKVLLTHSGVIEDIEDFIGRIKKFHEQH
jgi:thiol-disulfide isomerase/thioredoxin